MEAQARSLFSNTQINITSEGRPYLGAALGTQEYVRAYVSEKVRKWIDELNTLSTIAATQPHAAFAAFIHGFVHKFRFICRVCPATEHLLQSLEESIRSRFIPAITGRDPPNNSIRDLLALPTHLGGMGLVNPTTLASVEYNASLCVAEPLKNAILEQDGLYSSQCWEAQMDAKKAVHNENRERTHNSSSALRQRAPPSLNRAINCVQEREASSWLTALPLEEFNLSLHKGAFRDAIALRYGWQPINIPSKCACGHSFTVEHALPCSMGGFPTLRHNEIWDFTANLMSEVCHDMCVEPRLQPVTGENLNGASAITDDGARLDIAANGFWGGRREQAFFDMCVFNPHAPSNGQPLAACYRKHENSKKRAYKQRVREIEHGSFTPIVLSLAGGLGKAATTCYKRLASMIAEKQDLPYSTTISWIRCLLSFSLLQSAIQCIRGTRSASGRAAKYPLTPVDLTLTEARIPTC